MQLVYGDYSFLVNGCDISTRIQAVLADSGRPLRYLCRITVNGWLEGAGQRDIAAQEERLRLALSVPYRSLAFKLDSGEASPSSLSDPASISGVRVVSGPDFPGGLGEYATVRRFTFEAEAEYVLPATAVALVSFTETVSYVGTGGPVTRHRLPVNGPPIKQIVYPASVVRAKQTGTAVGHLAYPVYPGPLWPGAEQVDQREIRRTSPRRVGRGFVDYSISWAYAFEAAGPLPAMLPSLPPA